MENSENTIKKTPIDVIKDIVESVHHNANWFDESHEYERMNDLDKAYLVLKAVVPIVEELLEEKDDEKKYEKEFGERPNHPYMAVKKENADRLLKAIEYARALKPFGLEDWESGK